MFEKIKNIGKDELLRGSMILFVMLGIFNFLNYVFQISMAKMLGPADYGVLATLMSIVYIFSIPSESIQTIISRYTSKFNIRKDYGGMKDLLFRGIRKSAFFSFIFFVLFLVIIALFLSGFLRIEFYLLAITGIILFCCFLLPITRGVLQGRRKFVALGFNLVSESLIKILASVSLVFAGLKVYGAITGVVIAMSLTFFLSFPYIKEVLNSKRKKTQFRNMFSYNLPSLIAISSIVLMYSIDIILARRFFSPELAGQYAFVSLIGKAIVFTNLAIGKAMFPISSERFDKGQKTRYLFKKSMLLVAAISLIALIFYFAIPEFIVKILSLWSDKYLAAANVLFILGLSFTLISLSNIVILYKLSMNKLKKSSILLLLFVVIEIILLSIFHGTLREFSIALLVSNLIFFIYSIILFYWKSD